MERDLKGHQQELPKLTSQNGGTRGYAQHLAGPLASTNQEIKMEIRTSVVLALCKLRGRTRTAQGKRLTDPGTPPQIHTRKCEGRADQSATPGGLLGRGAVG